MEDTAVKKVRRDSFVLSVEGNLMNMRTIIIEDISRNKYRERLDIILNRYNDTDILSIDCGIVTEDETPTYYSIIILRE